MNRQYNLRSANCDTIQVPVRLQVGDTEFISRVFDKNNHSQNGSNSDSNDSQSDLDCLELLDLSNDDENSKSSSNDLTKNNYTGSHMQASSSSADFSAQSMINQQILDQLQNIGHRLDRLDRKPVKKSSDLKKIESKSKPKQNTDMKEHTSMLSSASGVSKILLGYLINQFQIWLASDRTCKYINRCNNGLQHWLSNNLQVWIIKLNHKWGIQIFL